MVRLRLTEPQRSALECRGLEHPFDDDERALAAAWQGRSFLEFDVDDADIIWRALNDASNAEDAYQQDTDNDAALRRFAGRAAAALYHIARRIS